MTDRATQFHALYRDLRIRDQKRYYEDRRDEYRRAHRQVLVVRNALLVSAALAGAAGQVTSGTARAALAVGASVLAALAGAVTAFEALIGFPRLAKLYADAGVNLAEAEIDWDDQDPHTDLVESLHRVELVFRKENGQWGQLVVEAGSVARDDRPVSDGPVGTQV
ncbi:hypothetical protein [Alloactinosynnema sp. L-07]|uniref:SLATT domain-containing protein n=1 Tax=Alloactinosynnema sp. L-07 TaxID=1653480 RepID=UPI00065F0555|nr:SLATT domain-containing protein [Alloactinosynnema sp. L-07]CRK59114.1 hypothetical protein [Alloactinosynnema sp. L-07]